jgi:parvulin-like peptidyl-prolyl isomerase
MRPFTSRSISHFLPLIALLFLRHPASLARVLDRTLVTVNDEVILESDIDRFITHAKSKAFQELFGGIKEEQLKDRGAVLQILIDEKIINQQVKKLDLLATDQEVEGQIKAIEKRNNISRSQLSTRLQQLGTTMDEYKQGIRRQIERRNLIEREIRPTLEVTEDQIKNYYARMGGAKESEVQYHIAHILIEAKKPGAKARAEQIHKDVSQKPETFAAAAKDFSDDTSTLENGGDLGFFSLSSLVNEFRKAVPKTPVGQITAPIKTAAGFHIVKVIEKRTGDFANLPPERKAEISNMMAGAEMERKMALWLERKKRESHIREFTAATAKTGAEMKLD